MVRQHRLWLEQVRFNFFEDFLEIIGIGRIDEPDVQLSMGPFVKGLEFSNNVGAYRGAVHDTGVLREKVGEGVNLEILYEHICLGEQEDDRNCDRIGNILECAHSIPHLVLEIVNGSASLRTFLSTYQLVMFWQSTTVS